MEKKYLILIIISILTLSAVFGSLLWSGTPRSSVESKKEGTTNDIGNIEEEEDNTTIYNYNVNNAVTIENNEYPTSFLRIVEKKDASFIYIQSISNGANWLKINPTTGAIAATITTTITVGTAAEAFSSWYDRTNERIYIVALCESTTPDTIVKGYINLTDNSWNIVSEFTAAGTPYDIFIVSTSIWITYIYNDGGTYKHHFTDGATSYEKSLTAGIYGVSSCLIIGNIAYWLYSLTVGALPGTVTLTLESLNLTTGVFTSLYTYTNQQLGSDILTQSLAYDDSDLIYSILKDTTDSNKMKLWMYSIIGDTGTKLGEFNVALMLERNTYSSNNPPFNLEKAFGLSATDVNQLIVYQIAKNQMTLWKIADLTSLLVGYTIVSITDTYLVVRLTAAPNTTKLLKFESVNNSITSSWIKHPVRSWATCVIEYDSNVIKYTEGMFVQCIGTLEGVANQVIFEGYIKDIKDANTSDPRFKKAHCVNPAYDDLVNGYPTGAKAGDNDEHITDDLGDCVYLIVGTLADGTTALATITYGGGVQRIVAWNGLASIDQRTWYHSPTGEVYLNNGAVDSTINYADNAVPYIYNCKAKVKPIVYNYVKTEGAYVSGVKLACATPAEDLPSQQTIGKKSVIVTIPFANTTGLLDSWATALLALLGSEVTEVVFAVLDTTNGFIQPGKEITLTLANNPFRTIAASQYKIDKIDFNDRTGEAWYTVSSRVYYKTQEFEKITNTNDENLGQLAGTVVSHTSSAITAAHSAGNWKVFHSNGSGVITELAVGAANLNLQSNGVAAAPTFAQPNHVNLSNIGTTSHADIDTHIGLTATAHGGSLCRIATGTYTGNGNANRVITSTLAFQPKHLNVAQDAGGIGGAYGEWIKTDTMGADEIWLFRNDVDGHYHGVTFQNNGFTVATTGTTINYLNAIYHWTAWG